MLISKLAIEFEWDRGNSNKNKKHGVEDVECEECFFDKYKHIFKDELHSKNEVRFRLLGKTKNSRLLFVVFTERNRKIRIISVRDVNKKEVYLYEKKIKATKI